MNLNRGAIPLGSVAGIRLFLHWSWFLVAAYEIQARSGRYSSVVWNVLEYLAIFVIVLLHEFGHAFACRQVGGTANQIMLWPLGGIAYVDPPQRPGATLWSIAAGPLVNVALIPILWGAALFWCSGWVAGFDAQLFYAFLGLCASDQFLAAGFQHSPHLSAGWWKDSLGVALVFHGACPQSFWSPRCSASSESSVSLSLQFRRSIHGLL